MSPPKKRTVPKSFDSTLEESFGPSFSFRRRRRFSNSSSSDEEDFGDQDNVNYPKVRTAATDGLLRLNDQNIKTLMMSGIAVEFPFEPYPAQKQMMAKIIQALKNKQNALLESPTGSGKSLAILCAALAWSKKEYKEWNKKLSEKIEKAELAALEVKCCMEDEPTQQKPEEPLQKPPKIFVGSRTHKQLAQLTNELRRNTRYRPEMAVLGSRDYLCINDKIRDKERHEKVDACKRLLDSHQCRYFDQHKKLADHQSLSKGGDNHVWDIEDLNHLGRGIRACPYYAARALADKAEIIFCPYSYLFDPVIRLNEADKECYKNSVYIFDEAHNLEDVARSAATVEITEKEMMIMHFELNSLCNNNVLPEAHQILFELVGRLYGMTTYRHYAYDIKDNDHLLHLWAEKDILNQLASKGITNSYYMNELKPALDMARKYADEMRKKKESETIPHQATSVEGEEIGFSVEHSRRLSAGTERALGRIFMVFEFLFEGGYADDYRMVLTNREDMPFNESSTKPEDWKYRLGFWCLNPAVIFRKLSEEAHSVILTSGTLFPMNTFASELGTEFPIRLEAKHVIEPHQVCIRAISQGPLNGALLKGTYEYIVQERYQDSIGEALRQICETVPHGVICFLSSYKMLQSFLQRMGTTGTLAKIKKVKKVVTESRGGSMEDFEYAVRKFQRHAMNGALYLAVFRGKVSEGIDFPDHYCRAIVSVGIPYSSIKDVQIIEKRKYNDARHKRGDNVLSGQQWYESCAFRVFNQGLGRCIRHKNDWGAIILLDCRFTQENNRNQLSKWVRELFRARDTFSDFMYDLQEFMEERQRAKDPKQPATNAPSSGTFLNHVKIEIEDDTMPSREFAAPLARLSSSASDHKRVLENDISVHDSDVSMTLSREPSKVDQFNAAQLPPTPGDSNQREPNMVPSTSDNNNIIMSDLATPEDVDDEELLTATIEAEHSQMYPTPKGRHATIEQSQHLVQGNLIVSPSRQMEIGDFSTGGSFIPLIPETDTQASTTTIVTENSVLDEGTPRSYNVIGSHINCKVCGISILQVVQNQPDVLLLSEMSSEYMRSLSSNVDSSSRVQIYEITRPANWKMQSLIGGPIDCDLLPRITPIFWDRVDMLGFRPLSCGYCNAGIGAVVCLADQYASPDVKSHVGKIWLLESKVHAADNTSN